MAERIDIQTSGGGLGPIARALEELAHRSILLGIAEDDADRPGGGITNAELLFNLSKGVRSRSMRRDMAPDLAKGMSYTRALALYLQEKGSPLWHSHPRPVLEPSVEDTVNQAMLVGDLRDAALAALEGDLDGALERLETAATDAQNAAQDWFTNPRNGWPPNDPRTVARKGSSQPMIDTGAMRQAIVGRMVKDDGEGEK